MGRGQSGSRTESLLLKLELRTDRCSISRLDRHSIAGLGSIGYLPIENKLAAFVVVAQAGSAGCGEVDLDRCSTAAESKSSLELKHRNIGQLD